MGDEQGMITRELPGHMSNAILTVAWGCGRDGAREALELVDRIADLMRAELAEDAGMVRRPAYADPRGALRLVTMVTCGRTCSRLWCQAPCLRLEPDHRQHRCTTHADKPDDLRIYDKLNDRTHTQGGILAGDQTRGRLLAIERGDQRQDGQR